MGRIGFDLAAFSLSDMVRCSAGLREAARDAPSFDAAAQAVADFLYRSMTDGGGGPACPAVRLFTAQRWDSLAPEVRTAALPRLRSGTPPPGDAPCLALAASRLDEDFARHDPLAVLGHLSPPLPTGETAERLPVVSRLVDRLAAGPAPAPGDAAGRRAGGARPFPARFDVVHLSDTGRMRELWGEEVVDGHGIRSALAFGGPLPDGGVFVVAVLSRVAVPPAVADLFRTVAVSVRMALLGSPVGGSAGRPAHVREEAAADLLNALEASVEQQAAHLEALVEELGSTARELRRSQRELRRREEELREEAATVEALQRVGSALTAELDLDAVVQHATDAATRLTGAAFGAFFYNATDDTGESYVLYVISGVERSAFERFPMPRNTPVFETTFRGTGVIRSDDITADPRYGRNPPYRSMPKGHLPLRSYLAVPVVSSRGEVMGGFFFGHPDTGVFTERHEQLAVGVAAQTCVAMENARLYRREREAAMELQRHLLPVLHEVEGLESASRYLPATSAAEVGGDWVDLIPLPDGRVALVVGDVMGKGTRAAAVMGQIRTACRAYALLGLPPATVMERLSALVDEIVADRIITCAYAVLDADRSRLRVANAGHLPPVLREPEGRVRFLDERVGPPLGAGRRDYLEQQVAFRPGARLLLYTDGLVEQRGRSVDIGLERLEELLAGPAREVGADCDAWVEALASEGRHDDDIAVLYVHRPAVDDRGASSVSREYPPVSDAVPDARRLVTDTLREWQFDHLATDMTLIADEMVANAVRHAGTPLRVELRRTGDRVVLEVADRSTEEPRLMAPAAGEVGHRGIFLIDAIAVRWGTRRTEDGKVVWAEVRA